MLAGSSMFAQSSPWGILQTQKSINNEAGPASSWLSLELDEASMLQTLKRAQGETSTNVVVPMADGSLVTCVVWQSEVLPYKLARKYPGIKTYAGYVEGAKNEWVRLDYTYRGFHATIGTAKGIAAVTPAQPGASNIYQAFYKKDQPTQGIHECGFDLLPRNNEYTDERIKARAFGPGMQQEIRHARQKYAGNRLLFRFAVAATGEYSANHGGTKPTVLSDITTSVNNLNALVGRDMNLQFQLVADNDDIIFLNAGSDPYSPNAAFRMLDSNQAVCDRIIGAANYDLGHVVTHGRFGGIASSPATCFAGFKGQGYSSNIPSSGPTFDVDYLAHEVGHQLGAPHNFSATSCFNVRTGALNEPGSGTTIMCYAGTCSGADNVEGNSEAMYHSINIADYASYVSSPFFGACPTSVPTGNSLPVANAGGNVTIPRNTPFQLVGSATDGNNPGDLTYSWEQIDGGGSETAGSPSPDSTNNALFRTFLPQTTPIRTFPNIADLASGATTRWEVLPDTGRTMNFSLIVRDNFTFLGASTGDIDTDDIAVTVDNTSGPFEVTYPTGGESLSAGFSYTITWNVAGSAGYAPNVAIELSDDGGLTYPYTLLASTPNDGSELIIMPGLVSSTSRIRVRSAGSGHFFFDISDTDFDISGTLPITLGTLNAQALGGSVALNWEVLSTEEYGGCVLERKSKDETSFGEIARFDPVQSNFDFTDTNVQPGDQLQYRIGWFDMEGNTQYGNAVEVNIADAEKRFTVYPNPARSMIQLAGNIDGTMTVQIIQLDGKVLLTKALHDNERSISLEGIAAGFYMLRVHSDRGQSEIHKILVTP